MGSAASIPQDTRDPLLTQQGVQLHMSKTKSLQLVSHQKRNQRLSSKCKKNVKDVLEVGADAGVDQRSRAPIPVAVPLLIPSLYGSSQLFTRLQSLITILYAPKTGINIISAIMKM